MPAAANLIGLNVFIDDRGHRPKELNATQPSYMSRFTAMGKPSPRSGGSGNVWTPIPLRTSEVAGLDAERRAWRAIYVKVWHEHRRRLNLTSNTLTSSSAELAAFRKQRTPWRVQPMISFHPPEANDGF